MLILKRTLLFTVNIALLISLNTYGEEPLSAEQELTLIEMVEIFESYQSANEEINDIDLEATKLREQYKNLKDTTPSRIDTLYDSALVWAGLKDNSSYNADSVKNNRKVMQSINLKIGELERRKMYLRQKVLVTQLQIDDRNAQTLRKDRTRVYEILSEKSGGKESFSSTK